MKQAEIAIAERDRLKVQSEAKDEVITAKDSQIAALRALLQLEKQTAKDWMEAALNRKEALKVDDRLILTFEKRVADLQAERDAARRANKWYAIGGFIVGAAVAIWGSK